MGRRIVVVIVVLVLLLAAAGAAAFLFLGGGLPPVPTTGDGETTEDGEQQLPQRFENIVVAAIDIPANTVITDTDTLLAFDEIPEDEFELNPGGYVTNIEDVRGKLITVSVGANQQIDPNDLIDPGLSQQIPGPDEPGEPRPKAYPLRVDALTGVADQIIEGDFVDVVVSAPIEAFVQVTPSRIEERTFFASKTVVQRAEVLRIVRPPREPSEGVEGEEPPPPGEDVAPSGEIPTDEEGRPISPDELEGAEGGTGTITQGNWIVVLAVTDQEAEVLEFTVRTSATYSLVLRGAGDEDIEETIGVTLDILVDEFGFPSPAPVFPLFEDPPS